jgi:hypothetical protein
VGQEGTLEVFDVRPHLADGVAIGLSHVLHVVFEGIEIHQQTGSI